MSKHKKQHFVPSSYLKAWCDPKCPNNQTPYVWRFSFDGTDAKKKAPDNIFHETDMYTIKGEDGERNLYLEHGLQQLETKFARIGRNKLRKKRDLTIEDNVLICAFIAATQSRTKAMRDHWKKNWELPLKKMEDMMEWAKTATPEEKKRAASISSISSLDNNKSLDYEQIKELHENPLQKMLPGMISSLTPMLTKLNMAILCTNNIPGFITSDHPCVWFDPEAYKRQPLYRAPALMYPNLEITLPVSPQQTILLSRHDYHGYIDVHNEIVDEFNRRTRFHSDEYFVVNRNMKKEFWFDPGEEPDDSWEKTQEKKEMSTEQDA